VEQRAELKKPNDPAVPGLSRSTPSSYPSYPMPSGVLPRAGAAMPGSTPGARPAISPPPGMRPKDLPTGELIKQITDEVSQLAVKQIDLAKTELRANLRDEARVLGGLSLAGVGALVTLNLLLVTVVLALAKLMPGWAAGLLVSAIVGGSSTVLARQAWSRRVREPFARTRRTFRQEVEAITAKGRHS
jgi:hypothetical protein